MPRTKPITGPDGTVYPSRKAAAAALGVHISTITWHLKRYGNLNLIGTWSVPCEHHGQAYPSLKACADALGLKRHTLNHHLRKHGNLDLAGSGKRKGNLGNRGRRIPLSIGPMRWDRRTDAAADLGVSLKTLRTWLSKQASPAQRDRLLAEVMKVHAAGQASRDQNRG